MASNSSGPTNSRPLADPESQRQAESDAGQQHWKRWGPYLAERQWGTVREDYSANGDCWDYLPHDHARSRAYRWGEDGLLGISDHESRLCFALALWNGKDPILKERLFGLSSPEGNHGEDVKEHYFYLDSTPTHSYMKALYKYPQSEFPYARLVHEGRARTREQREFEIEDSGVFDGGRYWDVQIEYAKASPEDVHIRLTISNRGPDSASLHLLPTLWFRNTWSWGRTNRIAEASSAMPLIKSGASGGFVATHEELGKYELHFQTAPGAAPPPLLFTDNVSNAERLWDSTSESRYRKDAFHQRIIRNDKDAVSPTPTGTKAAAWYTLVVNAGASVVLHARLVRTDGAPGASLDVLSSTRLFEQRIKEADAFYNTPGRRHDLLSPEQRNIARQAAAGLLWTKQFYYYDVPVWLNGDPDQPLPPASRLRGRNFEWRHLNNKDIISMPDKWEYPWYGAWDLAFQMIPFARLDPHFAKSQLVLLLREWYMHPSGQLPAYEFAFGDVNPPVHAWAVWRVYKITGERGKRDRFFLARCFQKLLLNFTWWVNRKDPIGNNIFSGGFLGLDNIGVFDRSRPLPTGGHLEQADGTAWMAFFCGTMLNMALELAREEPEYEDIATKFFEHFIAITDAMNSVGGTGLWDEQDGFYYDQIRLGDDVTRLRVRSLVGVIPLLAVEVLEGDALDHLPDFKHRMEWFLKYRSDLSWTDACSKPHVNAPGEVPHRLLSIPSRDRLVRVVRYLLDENEFLSPYGIRSVSRFHEKNPYVFCGGGEQSRVDYCPGESTTGLFGGNSNWRGPIWFPLNFLVIEALERYHHYYGDELTVETTVGGGRSFNLKEAADEIRARLTRLFLPDSDARRPCHGEFELFSSDAHWKQLVYFHEHFHADTGRGLGASHQTGWTALILEMLRATRLAGQPAVSRKADGAVVPKKQPVAASDPA